MICVLAFFWSDFPSYVSRLFVKEGTPSFIVLVKGSTFSKQFLTGKKIHKPWEDQASNLNDYEIQSSKKSNGKK